MKNNYSKRLILINVLLILLLIYFSLILNDNQKILLIIPFLFIISWFFYQNLLRRKFSKCIYETFKKCDSKAAKDHLFQFKKIDKLHLFNLDTFILECSLIIDNYTEESFESFVNKYKNNSILKNKYCSITFDCLLLQYFFLINAKTQFNSLYQKVFNNDMTKFFVLTEYYKRLFEIIYQYLNSGENNTIKQLKNLLKLDLTQRDKIYLNIFCYIIKKREDPSKKITLEKDTLDFKNFPILNTLERFV